MKSSIAISALLAVWLGGANLVMAQDARTGSVTDQVDPLSSDPSDPGNLLREIEKRNDKWKTLNGLRGRSDARCKKMLSRKC